MVSPGERYSDICRVIGPLPPRNQPPWHRAPHSEHSHTRQARLPDGYELVTYASRRKEPIKLPLIVDLTTIYNVAHAPRIEPRKSRPRLDLDDGLDLDGHAERQRVRAHRGTRVHAAVAEHLK